MPTIADNYAAALLADAAYVPEFWDGMQPSDLETALKPRMTSTLAKFIADNFEIASTIDLEAGSGFNATAWRGRAGTPCAWQIHVLMRGTSSGDDGLADISLALSSLVRGQVQDMVNWWLRVSTPTNASAVQVSYEAVDTGQVDMHGAPIYEYQWTQSSVQGEGLIAPAELAAGVYVNGHSLGGYLAAAFIRLLGNYAKVKHTTTFNSAGFAADSDPGFNAIAAANEATFAGRPGRGSGGLRRASQDRTKACVGAML